MKRLFIVFILIVFFYFLKSEIAFGAPETGGSQLDYVVKPFLVIPSNWRDRVPPSIEDKYKKNILKGLGDSQQLYASKLSGHTFNFDSNIQTINAAGASSYDNQTYCVADVMNQLNVSDRYASLGNINIFFIIGSGDLRSCASGDGTNGEAYMSHQALEQAGSSDVRLQRDAVGVISHELGHSFGLVMSGWSKAHPCSSVSKDECIDIPGLGNSVPYPAASEYTNDIMGSGNYLGTGKSPNAGFNNSIYNPEINKLFETRFINPTGNSAPPLTTPPPQIGKITQIFPNPIIAGNELVIAGSGFGQNRGYIRGGNPDSNLLFTDGPIISWTDSEIKVKASAFINSKPPTLPNYATTWKLSVFNSLGEEIKSPSDLVIQPNASNFASPSPTPSPFPTPTPTPTPIPTPKFSPFPTIAPPTPTPFSPSPSPTSTIIPTTPTPTPTSSSTSVITQIKVSNYNDFRNNPPGEEGNTTATFTNQSATPIIWKKSTLDPNSKIYVNIFDLTGTSIGILGLDIKDGQLFQVPNSRFIIQAKVIKKVVKIHIKDQDISDFTQTVRLHLDNLVEGVPGTSGIPVTITYSDGSTTSLLFTFNYKPLITTTPSPFATLVPSPTSLSPDEAYCHQVGGVCQTTCSGEYSSQVGTATCPSKNQLCCSKPVATPQANASKCPSGTVVGPVSSGWGGPCTPGKDVDRVLLTDSGTACTVASCYLDTQITPNEYCWYNSGTPYNSYDGCYRNGQGVKISTPTPVPATSGFSKTGECYTNSIYNSNICGTTVPGAGGQCDYLGQLSTIPCTKICPDGSSASGTSVSACGADGCYTNSCVCEATCP